MNCSQEELRKFMQLYKEEFDTEIAEDEAQEVTSRLINLYLKLMEPLPSERTEDQAAS